MADAQSIRNRDFDLGSAILDADAWILRLHGLDFCLHRRKHFRLRCGIDRHDIQFRQVPIGLRLPNLNARARAAIKGKVRVAGTSWCFPIPDDVQLRMDPFERVRDERVAVVLQASVLDERRKLLRKASRIGHAAEVGLGNPRRPALRGDHLDVGVVVDRTVGEQRPLNQIDEMRADVARRLALFVRVEKPRRPDVRRTGDDFHQVVDALHVNGRLGCSSGHDLAERRAIVDEQPLQHRRHLEALGHDVVGDELLRVSFGQGCLDFRQVGRLEDPGLVGEHMEPAFDRGEDAIHLHAVAPGKNDDVAWPLLEHPLEVVRAGVHLEVPVGGTLGTPVEGGYATEMLDEIRPERRVDVNARRHARIHLFLNQRGVEVARIERHQTHVRCRSALLSAQHAAHGNRKCADAPQRCCYPAKSLSRFHPASFGIPGSD